MLPALRAVAELGETSPREVIGRIADEFHLTADERAERIPSGRTPLLSNRIHWAVTSMLHAGLLEKPRRGVWRVTPRGRELLTLRPTAIGLADLKKFEEFAAWHSASPSGLSANGASVGTTANSSETPEELPDRTWRGLRGEIGLELLARVKASTPEFWVSRHRCGQGESAIVVLSRIFVPGTGFASRARVDRAAEVDVLTRRSPSGATFIASQRSWAGAVKDGPKGRAQRAAHGPKGRAQRAAQRRP